MRAWILASVLSLAACAAEARARLDLEGFQDADGAISVQHRGDTVDPYFALQALLLARQQGLDAAGPLARFVAWLLPRQKPDATFDRFCRRGPVWAPCKTADADDALLSMWMQALEALPGGLSTDPRHRASHAAAQRSLERLRQPAHGLYYVSPVFMHALFMDNVEVWWRLPRGSAEARALQAAINRAFWDPAAARYRVSTQPGPGGSAFYPDTVAQIYPLLLDFPVVPRDRRLYYRKWMRAHRAEWLDQGTRDFAWGVVALVALRHGDLAASGCWMHAAPAVRHGPHWTVSDEVALQVLEHRGVAPARGGCA
jgi:hypothetical protein